MEYMWFADGTLKVCERIPSFSEVKAVLMQHAGIAYYWHNADQEWLCITPDTDPLACYVIDTDKVPTLVRLADMLR